MSLEQKLGLILEDGIRYKVYYTYDDIHSNRSIESAEVDLSNKEQVLEFIREKLPRSEHGVEAPQDGVFPDEDKWQEYKDMSLIHEIQVSCFRGDDKTHLQIIANNISDMDLANVMSTNNDLQKKLEKMTGVEPPEPPQMSIHMDDLDELLSVIEQHVMGEAAVRRIKTPHYKFTVSMEVRYPETYPGTARRGIGTSAGVMKFIQNNINSVVGIEGDIDGDILPDQDKWGKDPSFFIKIEANGKIASAELILITEKGFDFTLEHANTKGTYGIEKFTILRDTLVGNEGRWINKNELEQMLELIEKTDL